jgi:YHS domain-containing protein
VGFEPNIVLKQINIFMNHQNFLAFVTSSIFIVGLTLGCRSQATTTTVISSLQPTANGNFDSNAIQGQNTPVNVPFKLAGKVFNVQDSFVLKGFDAVAYFQQGKATPGNANFTYKWQDVNWRFSTAENRNLFIKNPEKYAPQYGGFCAWAVSRGYTAPIDPNAWKIVNGKLYLNVNLDTQKRWEKDIPGNIQKADQNWPGIAKKIRS